MTSSDSEMDITPDFIIDEAKAVMENLLPQKSKEREKVSMVPPVVTSMQLLAGMQSTTIDAVKRRQIPAWIREGLEKMEREKQRAIEREQEKKARELAEIEKKKQEEEELERMKAKAG